MARGGDRGRRHAYRLGINRGTMTSARSRPGPQPCRESAGGPTEGREVGHLMGHLSVADARVRDGFIWYIAVGTFGRHIQ